MNEYCFEMSMRGIPLVFETAPTLFSPRAVDRGTLAMLESVSFTQEDKILDLGCGYGPVGILAAKEIGQERVTMIDSDPLAVKLARKNAERNGVPQVKIIESWGYTNLDETGYTQILSNPPYQSDFAVAKHFIEKGFNRLQLGGRFFMVTKRRLWYRNKIIAIFGGVHICERDGYFVFTAEKRQNRWANQPKR